MTYRLFSHRTAFLFAALLLLLAMVGCGAPMAAATHSSPTEASEAPADMPTSMVVSAPTSTQGVVSSAPTPTAVPTSTAMLLAPTPTQAITAFTPAPEQVVTPPPAILETRRLTLEYPTRMRAGVESDVVRLTLEVDNLGNITPTAQIAGNVITGQTVQIPDLYDTHTVTAEARLDLAGVEVTPPDSIFEPLNRGQSVTFYWSIRPQDTGRYRGTVWLHLNFKNKTTGEESRIPVSAQIIEIEAVDFFGFSVNLARTSGILGSVVGGVVGFPFLEDIVKFLFKKRRPKKR